MQKLSTYTFIILIFLGLFGCHKKESSPLKGKWELISYTSQDTTSGIGDLLLLLTISKMLPIYYNFTDSLIEVSDSNNKILESMPYREIAGQQQFIIADTLTNPYQYFAPDSLRIFFDPYTLIFRKIKEE